MKIHSEQEMLNFGRDFIHNLKPDQNLIELIGDVGAGKTTFTRGLADGLGIEESITSPSFTISKTYALPTGGNLIHYDFYRLSDPGLMLDDLTESLSDPTNIVIVEWADTIKNFLPENRLKIEITYTDNNEREVIIKNPTDTKIKESI